MEVNYPMSVFVMVLKAILKILEILTHSSHGTNDNGSQTTITQQHHNSEQHSQITLDQNTRLEQMWEVYNRIIKMKEEQARSDAEEIVKLRFKIEELQAELTRERRLSEELRTKLKSTSENIDNDNSETIQKGGE